MVVLVTGSRDFEDWHLIAYMLQGLYEYEVVGRMTVVHGDAKGADSWASDWTQGHDDVIEKPFPADWTTYGKAAGAIRNQRMLDEYAPGLCLAFVNKPLAESKGTADMVARARKAGVKTIIVQVMP